MTEHAPDFVYVTYIAASVDTVWNGLLDKELTAAYWGHENVSDWKVGSPWKHVSTDGKERVDIVGKVIESDEPHRLVLTWSLPQDAEDDAKISRVTFELTALGPDTKLTLIHSELEAGSDMHASVTEGWPAVCCNLKTLLETGKVLSEEQWSSVAE